MNDIKEILTNYHIIAVVGLSADESKDSFRVAEYMKAHGYRIAPVNPKYSEILGEKCYRDLAEIPFPVEIVNVFRRSEELPEIAKASIRIGAKVVWMQRGITHEAAAETLIKAGIKVVMDRCIKVEHTRLLRFGV